MINTIVFLLLLVATVDSFRHFHNFYAHKLKYNHESIVSFNVNSKHSNFMSKDVNEVNGDSDEDALSDNIVPESESFTQKVKIDEVTTTEINTAPQEEKQMMSQLSFYATNALTYALYGYIGYLFVDSVRILIMGAAGPPTQ